MVLRPQGFEINRLGARGGNPIFGLAWQMLFACPPFCGYQVARKNKRADGPREREASAFCPFEIDRKRLSVLRQPCH